MVLAEKLCITVVFERNFTENTQFLDGYEFESMQAWSLVIWFFLEHLKWTFKFFWSVIGLDWKWDTENIACKTCKTKEEVGMISSAKAVRCFAYYTTKCKDAQHRMWSQPHIKPIFLARRVVLKVNETNWLHIYLKWLKTLLLGLFFNFTLAD